MVTRDDDASTRAAVAQDADAQLAVGARSSAAISPENGWFVFTVVRHPAARLFSAWQSKLLLREPW